MRIARAELKKINEVLDKFPDVNGIELVYDGSGGIGYTLDIRFDYKVNGVDTKVEIEITGVDSW